MKKQSIIWTVVVIVLIAIIIIIVQSYQNYEKGPASGSA